MFENDRMDAIRAANAQRKKVYFYQGVWYNTKSHLVAHPRLVAMTMGRDEWIDPKGRRRSVHDMSVVGADPVRRGPKGNIARVNARAAGDSTYIANCPTHGDVQHSVLHGKCLSCFNTVGQPRKSWINTGGPVSVRSQARKDGNATYIAPCPTHGNVPHNTVFGKCLTCYTTHGTRRKRGTVTVDEPTARIQARRDGERTYTANCAIHGATDHDVIRGLCLKCYNTLGVPRPRSTNTVGYYVDRVGVIRECR